MAIVVPAMEKAARDLGYSLRVMDRSEYRAKTMITAARDPNLAKGRYICMVRGHVAAVVDGQVIDWSDGRRHQVKEVYEVVPSQDKTKTRESRPMKKMSGFSQGRLF
jgi:hypothetical protein